jgi:hypothetical protein
MAIYNHIEAENIPDFQGSISKTEVIYLPLRQLVIVTIKWGKNRHPQATGGNYKV